MRKLGSDVYARFDVIEFFYYTNIWACSNQLLVLNIRNFHACSVFLAAVDYKQFFLFGEVRRPWKRKAEKKKKKSVKKINVSARWGALRVGRLSPRAPCSALTSIYSFFFSLFSFPVCSLFTRATDFAEREGLLVMYRSRVLFSLVTQRFSECYVTRPSKRHARARAALISVFIMT